MTTLQPQVLAAIISAIALGFIAPIFRPDIEKAYIYLKAYLKNKAYQKEYPKRYKDKHGIFKVFRRKKSITLGDVYIPVQFSDTDHIFYGSSKEELEKRVRSQQNKNLSVQNFQKTDGIEVANKEKYLMVLGEPGTGKSTFLRNIGLEALETGKDRKRKFEHDCTPVFIGFKKFKSSESINPTHIETYISEEFGNCGFPHPDQFISQALKKGKLLILLDGLDEVPNQNVEDTVTAIKEFVNKHPNNRFILSCRTAAHRHFENFTDVVMADFDDQQIQELINKWFRKNNNQQETRGNKFWELLQKPENKAAKELAHKPLFLTLLCVIYEEKQNLPNKRNDLYKTALQILLKDWCEQKGVTQMISEPGLYTKLEELLSTIAYTSFEYDNLVLEENEIIEQIRKFLVDEANGLKEKKLDAESVLKAINIEQGILVEQAIGLYSFSLLTLQEYLTAKYIAENKDDKNCLVNKLATEHLIDKRWKEVFLLVAEMKDKPDDLLLLMEKEAQKYINTPKLQALLNWAEEVTVGSQGNYKPVGKRAVAISTAKALARTLPYAQTLDYAQAYAKALFYAKYNAQAYALAYTNANDNVFTITIKNDNIYEVTLTKDYANTNNISSIVFYASTYIDEVRKLNIYNQSLNFTVLLNRLQALRSNIPNNKQPKEAHKYLAKKLRETLINAFNLTPEMVNLSEEEIKAIENYLYTNHLIIQCKEAAVGVSRETWEAIEGRMLLPPGN